jgi:hypothetical protein
MLRPLGFTAPLLLALAIPAAASAATVSIGEDPAARLGVFTAAPGERNVLTFTLGGPDRIEFADTGAKLTGPPLAGDHGCAAGSTAGSLLCGPAFNVEARLGDLADQARTRSFFLGFARVYGGGGDDVIALDSHAGNTRAYGGAGDDDLTAGGEGGQLVDGGGGDDRLHVGGFAGSSSGFGGAGDDRMSYFLAMPQTGTGELEGNGGDDDLTLEAPGGAASGAGNAGADRIEVLSTATFSRYALTGGAGPDTLIAGPGQDTVDGGAGRDLIEATGGEVDTITCGDGVDTVRADSTDVIAADCERVTISG